MADKKHIAFVTGPLTAGGAERVVSTLCNELVSHYKVTLISFTASEPFYALDTRVNLYFCANEIIPSKNIWQTITTNYALYSALSKCIKEKKINLIIGFLTRANILSVFASKRRKIPVIISERNNPYAAHVENIWKKLWRYTYPHADFLVVQTQQIKDYFSSFISLDKIKILANPISAELTKTRNANIKRKNIVLNVGRLSEQKAQDVLIRAFSEINQNDWILRIVGGGNRRDEYEKLISELGMKNTIELLPPTKDIYEHYNSASIFAFTSIYEGFPNALTEAMHFGMACISTDCPTGPSELIKNGENGFLIPINNKEILKQKLNELISDENLSIKFGENAINSVTKYEANNIAKTWALLIEKAIYQRQ